MAEKRQEKKYDKDYWEKQPSLMMPQVLHGWPLPEPGSRPPWYVRLFSRNPK